jgi:hypothetical protein
LGPGNSNVENPKNKLNPMFLQNESDDEKPVQDKLKSVNHETGLKDQANDPKTRDQENDAKVRDTATDPMICEKSTDPKMQDIAIDAWKRDGMMQTATNIVEEQR